MFLFTLEMRLFGSLLDDFDLLEASGSLKKDLLVVDRGVQCMLIKSGWSRSYEYLANGDKADFLNDCLAAGLRY